MPWLFGCDSGKLQQRWALEETACSMLFNDAEELSGTFAMTTSGAPSKVPRARFVSGGWVRAQHSTAHPGRTEQVQCTSNRANQSGETFLFFATYLKHHTPDFGFGENALSFVNF